MIRILFPKICPVCGDAVERTEILCAECSKGYEPDPMKMPVGNVCGHPAFCRALYRYRGTMRRALLSMKFAGQCGRAEGFGQLLGNMIRGEAYDLIAYVPMDKDRERLRGYNQAQLLARHCGEMHGIPVKPVLYKTRRTGVQHDQQGGSARAANARDAYGAVPLNGARVLLCDDIVTSGTTLRNCVKALAQAGASEVQCICVAWTKQAL